MNRIKLILPVLLCYLSTLAQAQSQKEVEKQPILYEQSLPNFAAQMIPKHGKSLFWGKIKVKPNQAATGFHLYSLYAPELQANERRRVECHFALDIFSLQPRPQLLNRIFFVYKSSWPPTTFGISLAWVDPQTKLMPLLVIRSFTEGIYGHLGLEHFIAFPNSWKQPASINNLRFGTWRASDTGSQDNRLVLGQDNLTEIQVSLSPTTDELSPEQVKRDYTFTLRWNWQAGDFLPHAENPAAVQRYFPTK